MRRFRLLSRRRSAWGSAFTLVELLVSMAVFSIMALVLVDFTTQAGHIFSLSQDQNDYRLHARAVLDYMGRELRCASLAPNWCQAAVTGKPTLQFLVSPKSNTDNFPDSLFWQAPVATDDCSHGVMAEVGYFIHWDTPSNGGSGYQANLCRFFVNPSDTNNYLVYTNPVGGWATSGTQAGNLQAVAPANAENNYKGLFLENVVGLWVQAYQAGSPPTTLAKPYDTSATSSIATPPASSHPLPAYVIVSIAILDPSRAVRLKNDAAGATALQDLAAASSDPQSFVASGSLPTEVRNGLTVASINVALDNYR